MPDANKRFKRLRIYNAVMGLFHLGQGAAIVALAQPYAIQVTASWLSVRPGPGIYSPPQEYFQFDLGMGVALFLFFSAFAHFVIAGPAYGAYVAGLKQNRNYFRWMEYALSSSIMVVLIASLVGILDVAALTAIFGVNASMILFGWLVEKYEQPGSTDWTAFIFGCIAGVFPWIAIATYLWGPGASDLTPTFVYWIFVSMFVLFNSFAVNQILQYKPVGKWKDYLFGEATYIFLSLTAKSLLAWLVFANVLIPN
ncbi:MAG: heliorhodopsin HeR [Actinobacteria bacterium]|nr:heliorhodopsin HeR [Actinomycetota bacterium]MCL5887896.1 heliorhodopsin HeR [Actinomycetota bacterium]